MPRLPLPSTNWLGGETVAGTDGGSQPRQGKGLIVGDRNVELDPAAVEDLRARVEAAIGSEVASAFWWWMAKRSRFQQVMILLPHCMLLKFRVYRKPAKLEVENAADTLLIEPNEDSVGIEAAFRPRPSALIATQRA